MTVADRVKERREALGVSQETLAHRMGLKSRSSITRIEKSGDDISLRDVERLSIALDCSPLYLMGWENGAVKPEDTEVIITDKEREFTRLYSQLSPEQQTLVDNLLKTFLST